MQMAFMAEHLNALDFPLTTNANDNSWPWNSGPRRIDWLVWLSNLSEMPGSLRLIFCELPRKNVEEGGCGN